MTCLKSKPWRGVIVMSLSLPVPLNNTGLVNIADVAQGNGIDKRKVLEWEKTHNGHCDSLQPGEHTMLSL